MTFYELKIFGKNTYFLFIGDKHIPLDHGCKELYNKNSKEEDQKWIDIFLEQLFKMTDFNINFFLESKKFYTSKIESKLSSEKGLQRCMTRFDNCMHEDKSIMPMVRFNNMEFRTFDSRETLFNIDIYDDGEPILDTIYEIPIFYHYYFNSHKVGKTQIEILVRALNIELCKQLILCLLDGNLKEYAKILSGLFEPFIKSYTEDMEHSNVIDEISDAIDRFKNSIEASILIKLNKQYRCISNSAQQIIRKFVEDEIVNIMRPRFDLLQQFYTERFKETYKLVVIGIGAICFDIFNASRLLRQDSLFNPGSVPKECKKDKDYIEYPPLTVIYAGDLHTTNLMKILRNHYGENFVELYTIQEEQDSSACILIDEAAKREISTILNKIQDEYKHVAASKSGGLSPFRVETSLGRTIRDISSSGGYNPHVWFHHCY